MGSIRHHLRRVTVKANISEKEIINQTIEDHQKIETNMAHYVFCSLTQTDFNNHFIITEVEKKNWKV